MKQLNQVLHFSCMRPVFKRQITDHCDMIKSWKDPLFLISVVFISLCTEQNSKKSFLTCTHHRENCPTEETLSPKPARSNSTNHTWRPFPPAVADVLVFDCHDGAETSKVLSKFTSADLNIESTTAHVAKQHMTSSF